jgi:hypothetical protein
VAFSFSELLNSQFLFGAGGTGVLGFIGGHVKSRGKRITAMEKEIAECRKRDADVIVLKAGMRILVGKIKREQPESIELQMFGDLMARRLGPVPETSLDFQELLNQISRAEEEAKSATYGND